MGAILTLAIFFMVGSAFSQYFTTAQSAVLNHLDIKEHYAFSIPNIDSPFFLFTADSLMPFQIPVYHEITNNNNIATSSVTPLNFGALGEIFEAGMITADSKTPVQYGLFSDINELNSLLNPVSEPLIEKEKLISRRTQQLILTSGLLFISGFSDGTSEVLKIKYESFKRVFPNANDQFWDYEISWINKYKHGNPPEAAFPGSKTTFVWTTDGYHLMRMIRNVTMITAVVIPISSGYKKSLRAFITEGVLYYVSYTAGFNFAYDVIYK